MTVRITEDVRTGDYKNAQIVVMNENKIAKIHDPVYYAHKFYEGGRIKVLIDVVHAADKDFYREASAYAELQGTDAEGTVILRYYGSWTMEVHDEKGLPRTVALVLIEYIRGSCMRDVDVKALTQAHREDVVAKVLEADILLKHNGVCHRDLHPRNVIFSLLDSTGPLSPTDFSSPDLRITIIDSNMAKLSRLEGYEIGKLEGKKMDNPAWIHGSNISWAQYAGWLTKEDVTNHA
jgi:serine/threonine protein kinase